MTMPRTPDHCADCGDWLRDHPDGYQECLQCGVRSPDQVAEVVRESGIPDGWTWRDAECPNCAAPRVWEERSYGPGGSRGVWRCLTCEVPNGA